MILLLLWNNFSCYYANVALFILYYILSVTDSIQGPVQGLYILPVSPTEMISPIFALQEGNTGKIIVIL